MNRFGEMNFLGFKQYSSVLILICAIFSTTVSATIVTPKFPNKGVTDKDNNAFINPNVNYQNFMGRVTDKDDTGRILKIKVENNNAKFLKAGDVVFFKVNNHNEGRFCKASVRSLEDFYFSMYVQDYKACWDRKKYFPRGMQLVFKSTTLEHRVFEASKYRELLILRKEGFLKQLNDINHFLWTYDQQKLKTAADYDQQINALMREKQLALDNLIQRKQENLLLQNELVKKLDSLDESLDHYRVERQEYLLDRWNLDHEQDLPFARRPQKMKRP